MRNTASDEVQAILKDASKECSKRGYIFAAFVVHVPHDGSPAVFVYNASGGVCVAAEVLRHGADLIERGYDAGTIQRVQEENDD